MKDDLAIQFKSTDATPKLRVKNPTQKTKIFQFTKILIITHQIFSSNQEIFVMWGYLFWSYEIMEEFCGFDW